MLKRAIGLSMLGLAAIALAFVTVEGARGRGVAVNSAMQQGVFAIDVAKFTDGQRSHVEGGMHWETAPSNAHGGLRIEMLAREFMRDGRTAAFAGPAVATLRTPAGVRTIQGAMHVRVMDRRSPISPSNLPDTLAFRFISPTTNFQYSFDGVVRQGDIHVYVRDGGDDGVDGSDKIGG